MERPEWVDDGDDWMMPCVNCHTWIDMDIYFTLINFREKGKEVPTTEGPFCCDKCGKEYMDKLVDIYLKLEGIG